MSKKTVRRKRNAAVLIIMFPAVVVIGVIGAILATTGSPHKQKLGHQKPQEKSHKNINDKQDGVTFVPAITIEEDTVAIREH